MKISREGLLSGLDLLGNYASEFNREENGKENREETPYLTPGEAFSLRNSRRRGVLRAIENLRENEEFIDFRPITRKITAWENEKEINLITSKERKNVHVPLYQRSMNVLEESNLIEWNSKNSKARIMERGEELLYFVAEKPRRDELFKEIEKIQLGEIDPGIHELTTFEAFDSISNSRRYEVLSYMDQKPGSEPFSFNELRDHLSSVEYEKRVEDLNESEKYSVHPILLQTHLPKLDEYDVIDYRKEESLIEKSFYFDNLSKYIKSD